jgi:hypothetical protein
MTKSEELSDILKKNEETTKKLTAAYHRELEAGRYQNLAMIREEIKVWTQAWIDINNQKYMIDEQAEHGLKSVATLAVFV